MFGLLLGALAYCAYDSIKIDMKYAGVAEEQRARGLSDPTDPKERSILTQDFYYDWNSEKKLVPEEYVSYFQRNGSALAEYAIAWVQKKQMENGHKPFPVIGYYDKRTYDPFRNFHLKYDDLIEKYNTTGRFYHLDA